MFWRHLSQRIHAMQDPDLRAPGTDGILVRGLMMNEQVRLQGLNQTRDLQITQSRMNRCATEPKWPARADCDDVRVPPVSLVRTPQVKHALSAAHGKVPWHDMNQSWTAVQWPKF